MGSSQAKYRRIGSAEEVSPSPRPLRIPWRYFLGATCLLLLVAIMLFTGEKQYKRGVEEASIEGEDILNETLFDGNMQGRDEQVVGKPEQGFSLVNRRRKVKRLKDMAELDAVRVGYCKGVHDTDGKWILKDQTLALLHANNSVNMAMLRQGWRTEHFDKAKRHVRPVVAQRRICEAQHPRLKHANVRIERIGPLVGEGNFDWTSALGFTDALFMHKVLKDKTIYVLGRMFAAVDADGNKFNYPPLHTHHAHIYPYAMGDLGKRTIPPSMRDVFVDRREHHVLIQAHGDAICKKEEGGTACLLEQLPDGYGYRVHNSTGFWFNFEMNDVRPGKVPPLEYYVDIAMIYTEKPQIPTTFMQMGSPPLGLGWATYVYPLDPHHNFIYYNYTNSLLGDGTLSNFILHTHMSSFDSIYVLKGRAVYETLEKYRKEYRGTLPFVFECKGLNPVQAKVEILSKVLSTPGAKLICEGAKPSVELFCEPAPNEGHCTYRDKRVGFNCRDSIRLLKEETIVVLAFNRVRNVSTTPLTRHSDQNTLAIVSPFGMGYMAHQHSFFRADFVSDRAKQGTLGHSVGDPQTDFDKGNFAPPSLFRYAQWPQPPASGYVAAARRLIDGCKVKMDYKVNLPWNIMGL